MERNFCIKCGFSVLHCLLFCVFPWDQVYHLEQSEDTSYTNKVLLLHNVAAKSTQLWFCKALKFKLLSSITLHKIHIKQLML
jgi:hypothetical protein